jgi:hypothetical protein
MALDRAAAAETARTPIDQSIAEPLVIPFALVVRDVLADDSPKMAFAQRNHLSQAL